jgi:hypothetical protein
MNITKLQLKQLLKEETSKALKEKANPAGVDDSRFPTALGDVDAAKASALVQMGDDEMDKGKNDDVIPVDQDGSWAASELKPSQTSMNLGKAAWFALGMLNGTMYGSGGPGGETGAFVSSDNYLMDGHHRWIATAMADPSAPIMGFAVDFPGKQLVAILNTITKGLLGVAQGKSGTGGFEQFQDRGAMVETLTALAQDRHPKFKGVAGAKEPGMALKVMQEKTGQQGEAAIAAMADMFMSNLASVPGASAAAVMPGAPERKDMPVIDDKLATKGKPAVANTIKALSQGDVDVNKPYGKQQKVAEEKTYDRWKELIKG